MWDNFRRVKSCFGNGLWCLVGDFNAITSHRVRKGVSNVSGSNEVVEFRNVVNELELIDHPLLGRKFTLYKKKEDKKKKKNENKKRKKGKRK